MNKFCLFLVVVVACATSIQAQLNNVFYEVEYVGDGSIAGYPEGASTYRIYLSLTDATDAMSAMFATGPNTLTLGAANDEIWNSIFGGVTGPDLNEAFIAIFPELQYDSMVTIGRANGGDPGGTVTVISTLPTPEEFSNTFTTIFGDESGFSPNLQLIDGAWFVTPDQVNAYGTGVDNRVLVAQITSTSSPQYSLNVQILDGGLGGDPLQYVWDQSNVEDYQSFEPSLSNLCSSGVCSDPDACNFDPEAECEDTCYYVSGCTDITSCSYDPAAGCDDGSCTDVLAGCMDAEACNYDALAICDNGTCQFPGCLDPTAYNYAADSWCEGECIYDGCLDAEACNFDPIASVSDGSCVFPGCTDITSCAYDAEAGCDDGSCTAELAGCQDEAACNYDSLALCDNGTCIPFTCNDPSAVNYELDGECPGACIYGGCTDPEACNYEATASVDDGMCTYPTCLDPNALNFDPYAACPGDCIYAGCMDAQACNFNPDATEDGGDCLFPGCTELTACNYDAEAGCDNGSCTGTVDCSDPLACNYTPEPSGDCDEACFYPGCNDNTACNYESDAGCDDGSCDYGTFIQLFYDENQDGVWNTIGINAEGVFGAQGQWSIEALGLTLFADDEGRIDLPEGIAPGTYLMEYSSVSGTFYPTNLFDLVLELPLCTNMTIGLSADTDLNAAVNTPCCIWLWDIHCVNGINPGYNVWNQGTAPIYGTVTVTHSPLMPAEQLSTATPYDEATFTQVIWNIDGLAPGTMALYQCHLNAPEEWEPGEVFEILLEVELVNAAGDVWYSDSMLLTPEVICSYDPNDKYAVPEGYAEPHYVAQEEEIEYRIRFQNTGNAAAIDVRIEDQLDAENLDLDSFYPVFGSHDFTTCLTDEGHVTFNFNNIMLPDSTTDEPGSQGYVVYRIRPLPDLPHGTEINNTAEIYFDINDPIITNTTLHTIMECEGMAMMEVSDAPLCAGEVLTLETGTLEYIEDYSWLVMGDEVSSLPSDEYTFGGAGNFYLEHTVSNPICTETVAQEVLVNPLPEYTLTSGDMPCGPGTFEAEVSTMDSFQWLVLSENEALSVELTEPSTFTLEVYTDQGCLIQEMLEAAPLDLPVANVLGDTELCDGESTTLTLEGGSGSWTGLVDDNVLEITPEENQTLSYTVTGDNDCVVEGEVGLSVTALPTFTLEPGMAPCEGESYTAEVTTDATFQWDGLAANEVLNQPLNDETTFYLTVTGEGDCAVEEELTATPLPLPEATFTQDGNLLTAGTGTSWQWFLNGNAIEGATDQTLDITADGDYQVEITNDQGCSTLGDSVLITVISVGELEVHVALFPNPVQDVLTVQFESTFVGMGAVYSVSGQLVLEQAINGPNQTFDLNQLAAGTYSLVLTSTEGQTTHMPIVKR